MSRFYGTLIVGLLIATALAGCITDDPTTNGGGSDGVPQSAGDAEFDENTGAIEGQASSDLYEPLRGARVELLTRERELTDHTTTVDEQGEFTLSFLDPGEYIVFLTAVGYQAGQRAVTVQAGEVASVSFMLSPLASDEPYADEFDVAGRVSLAASWQFEVPTQGCVIVPGTGGLAKTCGGIRSGGEGGETSISIDDEHVATIMAEMVWTPAGPLGEHLQLDLMCTDTPRGTGGAVEDTEHECYFDTPSRTSPIIHRVDEEHWIEHDYNYTADWAARVFATYGTLGTYDLIGSDIGVAYEQTFMKYFTVFYREKPPEGYSRIPDA